MIEARCGAYIVTHWDIEQQVFAYTMPLHRRNGFTISLNIVQLPINPTRLFVNNHSNHLFCRFKVH